MNRDYSISLGKLRLVLRGEVPKEVHDVNLGSRYEWRPIYFMVTLKGRHGLFGLDKGSSRSLFSSEQISEISLKRSATDQARSFAIGRMFVV
ncbi:MAG: hypothetical protein NPIRA03_15350 [Nitrospirales bacterium]|nr:MAG: hypothetical protein NPIRA03_15350 [Nitrospirales bacterium]